MNAEKKLEERLQRLIDLYFKESDKELRNNLVLRSFFVRTKTDQLRDKLIKHLNTFTV